MKQYISFFIVLFITGSVRPVGASSESEIKKLLLSTANEKQVKNIQKSIEYLGKAGTNTPFIDDIELRGGLDDFQEPRYNYGIRINTSSWGETKYQQKILDLNKENQGYQRKIILAQLLRRRYELVCELKYYHRKIALSQKLYDNFSDRIKVLKKRSGSVDFKMSDLIGAENDLKNIHLEIIDLKSKLKDVKDEILSYVNSINIDDIIGEQTILTETISNNIDYMKNLNNDDNIYLKYYSHKAEVSRCKYLYEKNRDNRLINFFQLSYEQDNNNHDQSIARNYKIDLGIRIPITKTNQNSINSQRLNELAERNKFIRIKQDYNNQLNILYNDISGLLEKYFFMQSLMKNNTAGKSYKEYSQIKGLDPIILLKIHEQMYKDALLVNDLEYQINMKYIFLLDMTGIFPRFLKVNFLSFNNRVQWEKIFKTK